MEKLNSPAAGYLRGQKEKKLKKRILVILMLLALATTNANLTETVAATGRTKIFDHFFTVRVEPIEVQIKSVSNLYLHPGQVVEVVYKITNYSTQTHWNLTAELLISPDAPPGVNIEHRWGLRAKPYTPGTIFQIASQTSAELKIEVIAPDYDGEIPVNIKIYKVSGVEGKG